MDQALIVLRDDVRIREQEPTTQSQLMTCAIAQHTAVSSANKRLKNPSVSEN
jgi:hypothetical protein